MNILAVDLGGTSIKLGLISGGELVSFHKLEARSNEGLRARLPEIRAGLELVCRRESLSISDCSGIGIISTGLVDSREGRVLSANAKFSDAVEFDFNQWAHDEFGLPMRLENDAHASLLGEWRYGAARGIDNVVMLTLGTGIGCSVILQGRPLRGVHGQAGLLGGHIIVNPNGRKCTCPARGCVEAEASTWALPAIVRDHPRIAHSRLAYAAVHDYQTLFHLAADGDAVACEIRDHSLNIWGAAVVSLIHLFDPERVVMGGGVMHSAEIIIPWIQHYVDQNAWLSSGQVEIAVARHLESASLLGAGILFEKELNVI